jgi:hypothetical protein
MKSAADPVESGVLLARWGHMLRCYMVTGRDEVAPITSGLAKAGVS